MTIKYQTMGAASFKARCLRVMDRVHRRREEVVITKKGKPIAKLVPVETETEKDVFGCLAGEMEITGDVLSPVDAAEDWEAS
jgi:prevent-host-death family protein